MQKRLLILPGIAALVITGAALITTVHVSAQETDGQTTLVQKIAQRFGLQQNDVQAVFDEHREERHQQMQAHFEERLNQAVKDGKITEAQKQAILTKFKELQDDFAANRDKLKDISPEERKQAIELRHQDLKAWAQEQGIDLSLFPMVVKHHGMGMKMWADK